VKRLTALQKKISAHGKAWTASKLEPGKILLGLRKAAPHGTWESQLKEICKGAKIGRNTAHNYMDAALVQAIASTKESFVRRHHGVKTPRYSNLKDKNHD
jgi:hypothetical protein